MTCCLLTLAPHTQQPFVFHVLDETPAEVNESGGVFHIQANETAFSDTIVSLWTTFARDGAPSAPGVTWPQYAAGEQTLLIEQDGFQNASNVLAAKCAFWDRQFDDHNSFFAQASLSSANFH